MGKSEHLPTSVAIVSNSDTNIYRFRAPIMLKLLEAGVRVYAVAPQGQFVADIESMGVEFRPLEPKPPKPEPAS